MSTSQEMNKEQRLQTDQTPNAPQPQEQPVQEPLIVVIPQEVLTAVAVHEKRVSDDMQDVPLEEAKVPEGTPEVNKDAVIVQEVTLAVEKNEQVETLEEAKRKRVDEEFTIDPEDESPQKMSKLENESSSQQEIPVI